MPRTFVIGDIHGNYKPLMELFHKVGFSYDNDQLISLGDVVDRGPRGVKVVDELMKLRNFIFLLGNHDYWCCEYLKTGFISPDWIYQGGQSTIHDYEKHPGAGKRHLAFYESGRLYHIDTCNRLFVHAGFDPYRAFGAQNNESRTLLWDRSLYQFAREFQEKGKVFEEFKEIYIGHSPTQLVMRDQPARIANLWMMDTGAGHRRLFSIMDIDTKEFWQSKCDF